nr:hypothetical protein [Alcaligenes sp. HPC1271]
MSALTKLFSDKSPPKLRYIDLINPTVFTEIDLETAEKKHVPGGRIAGTPLALCFSPEHHYLNISCSDRAFQESHWASAWVAAQAWEPDQDLGWEPDLGLALDCDSSPSFLYKKSIMTIIRK